MANVIKKALRLIKIIDNSLLNLTLNLSYLSTTFLKKVFRNSLNDQANQDIDYFCSIIHF